MDPFSITTGVIGLIAVVAQLAETVQDYVGAVQDRKQDIRQLHQELLLLGSVLAQLRDFLHSTPHKSIEVGHNSVLDDAVSECTRRLQRLGGHLQSTSGGSKLSRTLEKLKWPLDRAEVSKVIESLQRFVQTFQFALTAQGLALLAKTSETAEAALREQREALAKTAEVLRQNALSTVEIEAKLGQLDEVTGLLPMLVDQADDLREMSHYIRLQEEREQEQQKSEILEWLVPAARLRGHLETQKKRADDTGGWFLTSPLFTEWTDISHPAHDILCMGNPGTGKTILASFVVDHLRSKYSKEGVLVINYYCSHFDEQTMEISYFMRVVLRQICQSIPRLPLAITQFYRETKHYAEDIQWIQQLQSVLRRIISTHDHLFLILDAVDEIQNDTQRNAILTTLRELRDGCQNFRVFVTTRPHLLRLSTQLSKTVIVRVTANEIDIRRFLRQRLRKFSGFELSETFQQEIVEQLSGNSDGTFLLPALQLSHVLQQLTKADMRRSLAQLSLTLDDALKTSLDRINALPIVRRTLALRCMMWISYAKRPLTMRELQHALAVREEESDIDPDDIVTGQIIIECCAGLVYYDHETDFVSFFHFSIDEYLRSQSRLFPEAEVIIARACLAYLSHEALRALSTVEDSEIPELLEDHPFFRYAAYHWGSHAHTTPAANYSDIALRLFDSRLNMLAISHVRHFDNPYSRNWKKQAAGWMDSGGAGVTMAAFFGLADLIEILLDRLDDQTIINRCRNVYGQAALHIAAGYGHIDACIVLINHGADLLDSGNGKATPFYQAVTHGRLETAMVLLPYDRRQLEIHCRGGFTALHKAANIGHVKMVEYLLHQRADISARDDKHRIPLHLAAAGGHVSIVQALMHANSDVNSSSRDEMPLDMATTSGHLEVCKILLDKGALVNRSGKDGWTPLFRACRGGHHAVAKILLQSGADLLYEDFRKNICLFMACRSGDLPLVKTLMEHDSSSQLTLLKKRDGKNRNSQQIALITAHMDVYKYLRDLENHLDQDAEARDLRLHNPLVILSDAIEARDLATVSSILQQDPQIVHRHDRSGQQPIHTAFIESAANIAEFLLHNGTSIHDSGFHGWRPLHIAASVGDLEMINLAIGYGADLEATTGTAQTPLLKSASSGSVQVIRRLLEAGANISARNNRLMTALHIAASKSSIEVLRELLRPEWNGQHLILSRDKNGNLPRDWARKTGSSDAVAFLRLQERLLDVENRPQNVTRISSGSLKPPPRSSSTLGGAKGAKSPPTMSTSAGLVIDDEADYFAQMVLEMESD